MNLLAEVTTSLSGLQLIGILALVVGIVGRLTEKISVRDFLILVVIALICIFALPAL